MSFTHMVNLKYTKYTNQLLFSLILFVVFFIYIINRKSHVYEGYEYTFPKAVVPTDVAPVSDVATKVMDIKSTEHSPPPPTIIITEPVSVATTSDKLSSIAYSAGTKVPKPKKLRTIIP